MSDDLISRKALLEELRGILNEPHNTMFLMGIGAAIGAAISIIEHRETSFDKEKVIEEIHNVPHGYYNVDTENEVIGIVEKGGIE